MLDHDRSPHGIQWRFDRADMQHGKETALLAALDRR
jgi:hypothetical protein